MIKKSQGETDALTKVRKECLDRIMQLRAKIKKRTGVQDDSTQFIRKLREGLDRVAGD